MRYEDMRIGALAWVHGLSICPPPPPPPVFPVTWILLGNEGVPVHHVPVDGIVANSGNGNGGGPYSRYICYIYLF